MPEMLKCCTLPGIMQALVIETLINQSPGPVSAQSLLTCSSTPQFLICLFEWLTKMSPAH